MKPGGDSVRRDAVRCEGRRQGHRPGVQRSLRRAVGARTTERGDRRDRDDPAPGSPQRRLERLGQEHGREHVAVEVAAPPFRDLGKRGRGAPEVPTRVVDEDASAAAVTCAGSPRSATCAVTRSAPTASLIAAAASSSTAPRRPMMTTSSPSLANRTATARPIPVPPPLTTTRRSTASTLPQPRQAPDRAIADHDPTATPTTPKGTPVSLMQRYQI
jgi:hypothetical protein